MSITVVNQNWIDTYKKKEILSGPARFAKKQGDVSGIVQTLQVVKKGSELVNQIRIAAGLESFPVLEQLAANVGQGLSTLSIARRITRLYPVVVGAQKSISALTDDSDGKDFVMKLAKAIQGVAGLISTYINSILLIFKNLAIGNIARFADLCSVVADLKMSSHSYSKASELEATAKGDVKDALSHSKHYYLLCTIKAVISLASAILGCIALTLAASAIATIALLVISLSNIVLAIHKDLYKDEGIYPVIDFDGPVIVGI